MNGGASRPGGPFAPRPSPPTRTNPKRVRNGVRLTLADVHFQGHPAARAWAEYVQRVARVAWEEGVEYARLGQTRRMSVEPGRIEGAVQGRADRAYQTALTLEPIPEERWEGIVDALADQARFSARLLACEMPAEIEEVFSDLGLSLFPSEAFPASAACTCGHEGPWCKHAVCLALLVAERLVHDPLLIFTIRGLAEAELRERLRDRRALAAAGGRGVPVYRPAVPGASDASLPALEACVESFWDTPEDLDALDFVPAPPAVSHPLLRRLGPSPFPEGRFPLVGLLATCYELVTQDQVEGAIDSSAGEPTLGAEGGAADDGGPRPATGAAG